MNQATSMKAVPAPEETSPVTRAEPTTEQIRNRAYEIYASRGKASGDELQDWLLAERELLSNQPFSLQGAPAADLVKSMKIETEPDAKKGTVA
jgi:hypothetical protein